MTENDFFCELTCGCKFSRVIVRDPRCAAATMEASWDPCGCHVMAALEGPNPALYGWPVTAISVARTPDLAEMV